MLLVSSVRPGQGLTQVIEKAETSLGIPTPTELSAQVEEEQKMQGKALTGLAGPVILDLPLRNEYESV